MASSSARRATQADYGQAMTELEKIAPELAEPIHEHVTALRAEAAWNRANATRNEREAAEMRALLPRTRRPPRGPVADPFTVPITEA